MENTFKTYLTVGLPKISVIFVALLLLLDFLFNFKSLIFCILDIWHPIFISLPSSLALYSFVHS